VQAIMESTGKLLFLLETAGWGEGAHRGDRAG